MNSLSLLLPHASIWQNNRSYGKVWGAHYCVKKFSWYFLKQLFIL